ncbi:MAG: DASS family sodium-coupled anion symporter [Cyclobacteriaceae bacterium]
MIDSRYEATKLFIKERWPLTRKVTFLLTIALLSWLVALLLRNYVSTQASFNALFLLLLAAGWWISEAMPPFAVSLFIIGFSIYFLEDLSPAVLSQDWEKYTNTWSNPIIWILLGGFFLAIGAQSTQLDKAFSENVLQRFGNTPKRQLLLVMLLTAVFSMFISNTSTTVMMFIIVGPMLGALDQDEPMRKAFALGIPAAATVGGMGTVIGSSPNAIALGTIQAAGLSFGFAEWMAVGMPLALVLTVLLWWLFVQRFPTRLQALNFKDEIEAPKVVVIRQDRWIVIGTFMLTISLWVTQPMHGLPIAAVSFIPIVLFSVTGIVKTDDFKKLPWDTLVLIAGGLTLGVVIHDSGLAYHISQLIPAVDNTLIILITFGYLASGLSNIMSNTAATSVLIPIGLTILPNEIVMISLTIGLCASTALILPISTPPNAIAYANGYLQQRDFRYAGIILGIFAPSVIAIFLYLLF